MSKDQNHTASAEWRLIFLSSGEIGLNTHLMGSGEEHRGGQFVRLVEIEADAGRGLGIFDHIGSRTSPGMLADELRSSCTRYYGTAITAYLAELVKMKNREKSLHECTSNFLNHLDPAMKSGQVMRVAKRFALIATGGIMGARMKILPFEEDEIIKSVHICFLNWAAMSQGSPDFETDKILSKIRQYLQFNGCAHFPEWDGKSEVAFTGRCCGFRLKGADGSIEWLVLNEVFKNEICKGLEIKKVTRVLKNSNLLKSDRGGKSSIPMRLPNFGLVRVYHLTSDIFTEQP